MAGEKKRRNVAPDVAHRRAVVAAQAAVESRRDIGKILSRLRERSGEFTQEHREELRRLAREVLG